MDLTLLQIEFAKRKDYLLQNPNALRSVLNDCSPGERARVNQLMDAKEYGIVDKIRQEANPSDPLFKQRMAKIIEGERGYAFADCAWVVDVWVALVRGGELPEDIKEDSHGPLLLRAIDLYKAGQHFQALDLVNTILEPSVTMNSSRGCFLLKSTTKDKDTICKAFHFKGNLLVAMDRYEEAMISFKSASENSQSGFFMAELLLGTMYENGRGTGVDLAKALEWYERALHTAPDSDDASNLVLARRTIGKFFLMKQYDNEAAKNMLSLAYNDGDNESGVMLAITCAKEAAETTGDFSRAISIAEELLTRQLNPNEKRQAQHVLEYCLSKK